MFRLPPQVDPAEERKRVAKDVRNSFLTFFLICSAIKIAPFLLDKVQT